MDNNLYEDIKKSIQQHFSFLTNYGFGSFREYQLAYEYHFEAKNDHSTVNIHFEAIYSTPIWITINDFYIELLQPDHPSFMDYNNALDVIYTDPFVDTERPYANAGKALNEQLLQAAALLLQAHPDVLMGDNSLLVKHAAITQKKREEAKTQERIQNGIYTLEYDFLQSGELEAFEEFTSIEAALIFLAENPEITLYKLSDCYMQEVKLPG